MKPNIPFQDSIPPTNTLKVIRTINKKKKHEWDQGRWHPPARLGYRPGSVATFFVQAQPKCPFSYLKKEEDRIQVFCFYLFSAYRELFFSTSDSPYPSLFFTFVCFSLTPSLNSQLSVCLHFHSFSSPLSSRFVLILFCFLCYLFYFVNDACYLLMGE